MRLLSAIAMVQRQHQRILIGRALTRLLSGCITLKLTVGGRLWAAATAKQVAVTAAAMAKQAGATPNSPWLITNHRRLVRGRLPVADMASRWVAATASRWAAATASRWAAMVADMASRWAAATVAAMVAGINSPAR